MSKYIQAKCAKNIYNPIIFGLYGQKEDYTFKFISNAILKNILNMPIVINQNVVFDYLYLGDFLRIIDAMIEKDFAYQEFNITPTESIDLVSIAKIINTWSRKWDHCKEWRPEFSVYCGQYKTAEKYRNRIWIYILWRWNKRTVSVLSLTSGWTGSGCSQTGWTD